MEQTKLDSIIGLFVSNREYNRDKLGKPVLDDGNVVACDGHTLLVAPGRYFTLNEEAYPAYTEKYPAYKRIIPEHDQNNTIYELDGKFVNDEANLLLREDLYTECERCDGHGHLYTHKEKERECDVCEGEGTDEYLGNLIPTPKVEDDKKGKKAFLFKIGEAYFNPNYLQNIARVANRMHSPIRIVKIEKEKACLIYIADIMILVMPVLYNDETFKGYKGDLTIIDLLLNGANATPAK